jgi:hypothetical protein
MLRDVIAPPAFIACVFKNHEAAFAISGKIVNRVTAAISFFII